jgi:hypothetical protein
MSEARMGHYLAAADGLAPMPGHPDMLAIVNITIGGFI